MIPIGPFSELTGLSVKALRNYHEQGLLIPERIDEDTQARAYSPWQVLRAARISALRRAGLSLERIGAVLDDPANAAELLHEHEQTLAAQRSAEDAALSEARLALAAEPGVTVRAIPGGHEELVVRVPHSDHAEDGEHYGAITLAVAHLISHEVPGYFPAIGEMQHERFGEESEFSVPLRPMPEDPDAEFTR